MVNELVTTSRTTIGESAEDFDNDSLLVSKFFFIWYLRLRLLSRGYLFISSAMPDPLDDFLFLGIYKLKATQGDEDNVMNASLTLEVGSGVSVTLVFYHEVTL